jgi:hypothetical protein
LYWTDHVVEFDEISSPENRKDDGAYESANEAFNGFLGRQFD